VNGPMAWVIAAILCTAGASSLFAGAGTSSADFLLISSHSRGMAMGGACVAVAEGTSALHYNPAGLGRNGSGEASVSHSALYQDLKLENLSVSYPLHNGSGLGLGVSYLGYGTIDGYDINGGATGSVDAYSLLLTIGFSQRISDNLSLGLAVKPVFEQLGDLSASTVTSDVGLLATLGQFSFGAQVANWGGSIKYAQEETSLPTTLRLGVAYRTLSTGSVISAGASRDGDGNISVASGIEYSYNHFLTLRTGYSASLQSETGAENGITGGIGLKIQSLGFDYSYKPSGELDGVHQFTASFHFGK
jgi:hypothetical protein